MSSFEDLRRRRDAILVGLRASGFGDSQVTTALHIWDERFARERPAAIIEYMTETAQSLRLAPNQRHEMRMAIYQALLRYDARRMPLPESVTMPSAPSAPSPKPSPERSEAIAEPRSPQQVIAEALLHQLRHQCQWQDESTLSEVSACLRKEGPGQRATALSRNLGRWMVNGGSLPADWLTGTIDELAEGLHLVYVAIAEALGPVLADRILTGAVQMAERLPEARSFPPSRLL